MMIPPFATRREIIVDSLPKPPFPFFHFLGPRYDDFDHKAAVVPLTLDQFFLPLPYLFSRLLWFRLPTKQVLRPAAFSAQPPMFRRVCGAPP